MPILRFASSQPTSGGLEDVLRHLQRLLNTRQGESLACPDYGLMDLACLVSALPHTADEIGRSIEACIRRFEPRLVVHTVSLMRDAAHLTLQFTIEASRVSSARIEGNAQVLRLTAHIDAQGRIAVAH